MKKMVRGLAMFVLFFCMLLQLPVSAAEKEGAENWQLDVTNLEHTSITFQLSGVERAQDAVIVITERYDPLTESAEDALTCEVPFSISNATEKFTLPLPEKGLVSGRYFAYVKDGAGQKTESDWINLYKHSFYPDVKLYPNWGVITNRSDDSFHASVTVGFQEYSVDMKPDTTEIIDYPDQKEGTVVELRCWDDYGCTNSYDKEIENERLRVPGLYICKEFIALKYGNLDEDKRLAAEVEGQIYYSDWGAKEKGKIIAYPVVADSTATIKVWMESKNGSVSDTEEEEIQECALDYCQIGFHSYPAKTTGTVSANEYGNQITRVYTLIDGMEYSCPVGEDGSFCLEYPYQETSTELTIHFVDSHGCERTEDESVYNTLDGTYFDEMILLSRAYAEVNKGCRLVVKIDGKEYYSEYAVSDQTVVVNYPKQKPGQAYAFWYEHEDSSRSEVTRGTIANRQYNISANVRTSSISGQVNENSDEYNCNCRVYVKVAGKEYECKVKKINEWSDEEYRGSAEEDEYYLKFSASYPKQKLGSKVQVIVRDQEGYESSRTFSMENIPPALSINRIDTATTQVKGTTAAGSSVTVKVGSKTYRGKSNSKGAFSIKIKSKKAGTKVTVSVLSPEGYSVTKTKKIEKTYGYPELLSYVYRTSTKVKIKVTGGNKGDKLKVKIGKKTYTKKLSKNTRKQKFTMKIKKAAAGTTVKIILYDKYGKKKDYCTSMVYHGDRIYVGMTAREAELTTWGPPVRRNNWGFGSIQWVFESGSTTLYAYIRNGKVVSIQQLNY